MGEGEIAILCEKNEISVSGGALVGPGVRAKPAIGLGADAVTGRDDDDTPGILAGWVDIVHSWVSRKNAIIVVRVLQDTTIASQVKQAAMNLAPLYPYLPPSRETWESLTFFWQLAPIVGLDRSSCSLPLADINP